MNGIFYEYHGMSEVELENELNRLEGIGSDLRWQTNMSTRASSTKSFASDMIENSSRITDLKVWLGRYLYDWQRPYREYGARLMAIKHMSMEKHKEIVKGALNKGYPVPEEVLNEYDDLKQY